MHRRSPVLPGLALLMLLVVACGVPAQANQPEVVNTSTPPAPALATPTPAPVFVSSTVVERYTVRYGDTLGAIAARYNLSIEELMRLNGLTNPNSLQIGQILKIALDVQRMGPSELIIPDSELVYGPAYAAFNIAAFANQQGGYLAGFRERVEGDMLSGPEIIQLVAERYSVGPRVLLALLEHQGGWVTHPSIAQTQLNNPMGLTDNPRSGLFYQASVVANRLNEGYYGKLTGRMGSLRFRDGSRARIYPTVNPGTAAIQAFYSQLSGWETWLNQISPNGLAGTYRRLFGDPRSLAVTPLVPAGLMQPVMHLPWNDGGIWYYTGGPHSAWGDLAAWAAIDLTPADMAGSGSCLASRDWVIAAAPGKIVRSERGRVIETLGSQGFQGSGWTVMYMHLANSGRIAEGTVVNTGDRIGHPSCEGGDANASHLHMARLYNGQWIDPETVPFVLSGWQVSSLEQQYDGKMTRGMEVREAANTRDERKSAIRADTPK